MWGFLRWIGQSLTSLGRSRLAQHDHYRRKHLAEVGWEACDVLEDLSAALGYPGGRKYRMLLIASCRKWIDLPGERVHAALDIAERFADGLAEEDELREAGALIDAAYSGRKFPDGSMDGNVSDLLYLADDATTLDIELWNAECWGAFSMWHLSPMFIKDIWPDPCRPVVIEPEWLLPHVRSIARMVYEERPPGSWQLDQHLLAVLSDRLVEAGCTEEAILSHLRLPGPHVRGCWPLDLVLGKSGS